MELIVKNGFTEAAKTTDTQNTVYHREWTPEVEVAWHGKQQDTLEIRMMLCGTGHARTSTTTDIYSHFLKSSDKTAAEKLVQMFE